MKIHLYTKKGSNYYWAEKYSPSETLIRHLVGERYFYDGYNLKDTIELAKAHGWEIIVHEVVDKEEEI